MLKPVADGPLSESDERLACLQPLGPAKWETEFSTSFRIVLMAGAQKGLQQWLHYFYALMMSPSGLFSTRP